jgi:DNA-binding transcriptional LysR family regulator
LLTVSVGGQEEGAVGGFILERGLARQSEMFDRQALEEALQREQERPRGRITVPHSLAIPELLRETDMLSIVPASLAVALVKSSDLLRREPPYRAEKSTIRAVWHRRDEHDVGHSWLREMVAKRARAAQEALG